MIPNVAIHMNRGMNDKLTYNPQTDLQPLLAVEEGKEKKAGDILMDKVAQYAGVKREDILGKRKTCRSFERTDHFSKTG